MLAASAPSLNLQQTAGPKPKIRRDETLVFPLRTAEGFMQGPVKRGSTRERGNGPGLEHSIYRRITGRHLTHQTGRGREWLPGEYHGAVGDWALRRHSNLGLRYCNLRSAGETRERVPGYSPPLGTKND